MTAMPVVTEPAVTAPAGTTPVVTRPTPAIRVLFADDSPAIRMLARHALSARNGCLVVAEASDGSEVLDLFDAHRPDCVVLDIEMPGGDGFTALAELRRRDPDLPVIMLSGRSDAESARRARTSGAAAYLDKSQLVRLSDTVRQVAEAGRVPRAAEVPGSGEPGPSEATASGAATAPGAAEELQRLTAELRRLEYVVSHDFAEPGRIVRGFASLLQSQYTEVLDGRGQVFLTHMVTAADRLQAMIDDLLVYSRAGRSEPHVAQVAVGPRVTEAVTQLRDLVAAKQAEVAVGELPAALADPATLTVVLGHVLRNALVFNRSLPPHVRVDGHRRGGRTVLTVTDDGIGVDPAQTEAVFELGRRLNTREEYPGTGTGLTLCRRLLAAQDGTISITSPGHGGSVVTLTLPAPHTDPGAPR